MQIIACRNLSEAIDQALSFGIALRPVNYDLINILFKYTYLDQQRPLALEEYHVDRTRKHVVSFVPMIELLARSPRVSPLT